MVARHSRGAHDDATGVARSHERFAYLQLAINVVLFGLSWPIIKVGLQAASPLWFAAARAALSATVAFALLAALGRLKWPARAEWPIVLSVGALQLASFFAFSNLGLQSLPAGRSSVLAYTASRSEEHTSELQSH